MNAIFPFIPLVIAGVITLLALKVEPALRLAWALTGALTILCALADWYLLARLPKLGLSFGQVGTPLAMFSLLHLGMMLLALFLMVLFRQQVARTIVLVLFALAQLAFLGITYDSLYREPFRLTTTQVEIHGAPAFLPDRPLRILQLTDLHVEHPSPRERAMLEQVQALAPDLIVLTGDYVNKSYLRDETTLQETRALLSTLTAPYGVYAVNGNVDTDYEFARIFSGLANIRVLNDEILPVRFPGGTLSLIGVSAVDEDSDFLKMERLFGELPAQGYSLLLYHFPQGVNTASKYGIQLHLAGHTHGGQVRLPLLTSFAYGRFVDPYIMGKYQVGPTLLYVSRGLGMQGGIYPRIRFACPPEMALISLDK